MSWAPPIAAHRLLGDGSTTGLLRPGGEVDWWCAPAMDSPPVLWSLLAEHGAAARWADVRLSASAGRAAGPVLTTVLQSPRGRVEWALYVLDAARLRARWGPIALVVWRGVRFVRACRARPEEAM